MKALIENISDCRQCKYFCDEGEFCHHPDREIRPHVIYKNWDVVNVPDDCPLLDFDANFVTVEKVEKVIQKIRDEILRREGKGHNMGKKMCLKWATDLLP